MLKRCSLTIVALVLLLSPMLGACAPVSQELTPTAGASAAIPKLAPTVSSATTSVAALATPQKGGTLIYALGEEAVGLDPQRQPGGGARRVGQLMFNTLVNAETDGKVIPELAESWSYPDPKTLVFKLKKGVKFHDGTDFNAEAVKFNVERILDPATKAYGRSFLANVSSVDVRDDYTVQLNLKSPQAALLGFLTETYFAMVSPTSVKKWGDETNFHPVGTGPFELVEWVKDDHLTVKRFNNYWRQDEYGNTLPYLDGVTVKPIPDGSVQVTNLRTGNADLVAEVLPSQLPLVKGDKSLRTAQYGSQRYVLWLNAATPPFDNKALRQATAWAVDRDSLVKAVLGGLGVEAKYFLDPQSWAFDPTGKFYTKDNAKAKEKLSEGGQPNGFKFVAKSYSTPLELQVAQAVKGQLAEVGIDMEILPLEKQQVIAEFTAGKFEASFTAGSGLLTDPDQAVGKSFLSQSPNNWGKYNNPEVDKLVEKAAAIYDQSERKSLYAKAQAMILEDSPVIFLYHGPATSAMNQKVMGFRPSIDIYHLQLDWVWIKR